jgi:hypothetical protein
MDDCQSAAISSLGRWDRGGLSNSIQIPALEANDRHGLATNGTQSLSGANAEERDYWDEAFEIILQAAWRGVEAFVGT